MASRPSALGEVPTDGPPLLRHRAVYTGSIFTRVKILPPGSTYPPTGGFTNLPPTGSSSSLTLGNAGVNYTYYLYIAAQAYQPLQSGPLYDTNSSLYRVYRINIFRRVISTNPFLNCENQ